MPRSAVPLLLLCLLLAAGCAGPPSPPGADATPGPRSADEAAPDGELRHLPSTVVTLVSPDGEATAEVAVRIAYTPEHRARGLMGVEELPVGTGMWFVFPRDVDHAFWMRDTLIPLDIYWADADGVVVAHARMTPCEADPCPDYEPGERYRTALEVPAGAHPDVAPGWRLEPRDQPPTPR